VTRDAFTTGALLLGGGLAGYLGQRWICGRERDADADAASGPPAPLVASVLASPGPEPAPTAPSSSTPPLDEPVSSPSRNGRSPHRGKRYAREGRTILRDGVAVVHVERVDLGDQRYAISPHETDVLTQEIVGLLNGRRPRRQTAETQRRRDGRAKDPWYRERWLVDDRCGYRAWLFWTGKPPNEAVVGDVWAYVEKPAGEIVGKRRFRTTDEAHRYVKAALKRALERAGKFDCY